MILTLLFRGSAPTNTVNKGPKDSFLLINARYFVMSQDSSFQSSVVKVQDPYSFNKSSKGLVPLLLIAFVSKHDL